VTLTGLPAAGDRVAAGWLKCKVATQMRRGGSSVMWWLKRVAGGSSVMWWLKRVAGGSSVM